MNHSFKSVLFTECDLFGVIVNHLLKTLNEMSAEIRGRVLLYHKVSFCTFHSLLYFLPVIQQM